MCTNAKENSSTPHNRRRNSSRFDAPIHDLLTEAERQGRCYIPVDSNERRRLDRRVRTGELVRPISSSYARKEFWDALSPSQRHVMLARTMQQVHPDWTFCGFTAAAILGFQIPYLTLGHLHRVVLSSLRHESNSNVIVHRTSSAKDIIDCNGLLITPPEQTARECMRQLEFPQALAVADSAARTCGWSSLHLLEDIITNPDRTSAKGTVVATCAAMLADSRSENGGESIARANMITEGFLLPNLQMVIRPSSARDLTQVRTDPTSHWTSSSALDQNLKDYSRSNVARGDCSYRADYAWPVPNRGLIIGELDGRQKYQSPIAGPGKSQTDVLLAERRREAELTLSCDSIVRFSFEEARNPFVLASLLDDYGIPRVREPLNLTGGSNHCKREVLDYLDKCSDMSEPARRRLNALSQLGLAM